MPDEHVVYVVVGTDWAVDTPARLVAFDMPGHAERFAEASRGRWYAVEVYNTHDGAEFVRSYLRAIANSRGAIDDEEDE